MLRFNEFINELRSYSIDNVLTKFKESDWEIEHYPEDSEVIYYLNGHPISVIFSYDRYNDWDVVLEVNHTVNKFDFIVSQETKEIAWDAAFFAMYHFITSNEHKINNLTITAFDVIGSDVLSDWTPTEIKKDKTLRKYAKTVKQKYNLYLRMIKKFVERNPKFDYYEQSNSELVIHKKV